MAGIGPLSAQQKIDVKEAASTDLSYLFAKEGVSEEVQLLFFHVGVTTPAKFATFAADAKDLKDVLKAGFKLDSSVNIAQRVAVAAVMCAFATATVRTEKRAELEGELEARRMTKPLSSNEWSSMKTLWETCWWPLEDRYACTVLS